MKYCSTLSRSLRSLAAAAACLLTAASHAQSLVFNTNFNSDQIHLDPPSITPTGSTWYIYSSKDGRASSISSGLFLTYAASSTASGMQGIARFTNSPLTLASEGDTISARVKLYTDNVRNLAVGLYNSGGVNPLTTLNNNGLDGTPITATTDGTLAWRGYRARLETGSASGNIAARAPQVGTLTRSAYDVIAANTGDFSSPGPIPVGSVPASANPIILADGYAAEYTVDFSITRTGADAFTLSYSVQDSSSTVLYAVSGSTTSATALPSAITSTFDAIAIGTRNNAPSGGTISVAWITEVTITANNAQVARVVNQPINQAWVPGIAGSISVTAAGAGSLSYQWFKDGQPLGAGSSATYTVPNPQAGDAGTYHVVVTNEYGVATSASATVAVSSASAPNFVVNPLTQTVNAGQSLTLISEATGAPTPSFQWFKGTTAIPGATQPTYTINAVQPGDAGTYYVRAINSSGTRDSSVATISVYTEGPAVVTPPQPVVVNVGGTINLTVVGSGYPAPTYQWSKFNGTSFVNIPGAVGASYTVPSATTPDAGTYRVTLTNPSGSIDSESTTVTVNVVLPEITTPPANATAVLGQSASFTVVATGSAPLSYQWYKGNSLISGATSANYTIAATTMASAGDYHVVVTNEGGFATSSAATLNLVVNANLPILTTDFANDTIHADNPVVTASRTNWYVMASKIATASFVGDDPATEDTVEARPLNLALNQPSTAANFQAATVFTATPVDLTQVGTSITVTATVSMNNVINLCFGLFNSGGSLPNTIHNDGAAATTLLGGSEGVFGGTQNWLGYRGLIPNASTSGDIRHRLAQNNPTPTNSRSQDLIVPGSGSVSYGQPAGSTIGTMTQSPTALTFVNDTFYTLVYEISRTGEDQFTISQRLYEGADADPATATVLFSASASTTNAATRPSGVTSSFDSFAIGARTTNNQPPKIVVSRLAVVHATPVTVALPAITTQPVAANVSIGDTLTLTAAASGSPAPTFQWFKGGEPIDGATSATYSTTASAASAGTYYVVATNLVGFATSSAVTVTVGGSASAYATWAATQGLSAGVNDGATQDPDGDGLNNALEFVLGGNPLSASSAPKPAFAREGNTYTFTYEVKTDALAEFLVSAQSSTDLAAWTDVVHGTGGATIATNPVDASTQRVVVTLPAGPARLFARVRVTPQP